MADINNNVNTEVKDGGSSDPTTNQEVNTEETVYNGSVVKTKI